MQVVPLLDHAVHAGVHHHGLRVDQAHGVAAVLEEDAGGRAVEYGPLARLEHDAGSMKGAGRGHVVQRPVLQVPVDGAVVLDLDELVVHVDAPSSFQSVPAHGRNSLMTMWAKGVGGIGVGFFFEVGVALGLGVTVTVKT